MKQSKRYPIVRSALALSMFSAGFGAPVVAQSGRAEETVSSSSQNTSLFTALLAPILPMAPNAKGAGSDRTTHESSRQTDFSIGGFGEFGSTRSTSTFVYSGAYTFNNFSSQSATASGGVLGAFRQQFRPWAGYSVNAAYTQFSTNYTVAGSAKSITLPYSTYFNSGRVHSKVFELTLGYVLQPRPSKSRFQPFVQGGGGLLAFFPTGNGRPIQDAYRQTAQFGAGVNYRISEAWGLRAEYRGLAYKSPAFVDVTENTPVQARMTVTSEPTVSLTYRFGAKPRKYRR